MFACATAKDLQTLMLCRFFAGVFASCPLAVVGGAFADMFGNETRGIAIAGFSGLVFIGPFISPIVGAFISTSYLGWRWTEYITGIMGALAFVLDALFLKKPIRKRYSSGELRPSARRPTTSPFTIFQRKKTSHLATWSISISCCHGSCYFWNLSYF